MAGISVKYDGTGNENVPLAALAVQNAEWKRDTALISFPVPSYLTDDIHQIIAHFQHKETDIPHFYICERLARL